MNYNNFPPGGGGKLRALLEQLREPQGQLDEHPLYREGYDDGVAAAHANYKKLFEALSAVYDIDMKN